MCIRDQEGRRVGDAHQPGQAQHDGALDGGHCAASQHLAHYQSAPPHRGHHHLPQETELPVPYDGNGRENGSEEHHHGQYAGEHEGAEVDVAARRGGDRRQPCAQHKEEQDGLSESRDHTGAVAGKADKLPPPHNTHGSKVIPQTTSGFAGGENLGLFWGRVWRSGLVHHYLLMCRRMKGLLRARSVLDDSASRIVWPGSVSYTHIRAHETVLDLVCRLLLEKKKKKKKTNNI